MKDLVSLELSRIKPYSPKSISEEFTDRFCSLGGVVNLAANESPVGPSPKVYEILSSNLTHQTGRYSISLQQDLRRDLSHFYNLDEDWIHLGAGIEEILTHLSRAFLSPGDVVLLSECTFPLYHINNALQGAEQIFVPLKNWYYDLSAFIDQLEQMSGAPRMVYLCNPNNPTGTAFSSAQFEQLITYLPEECIVVLDEAYFEYVIDKDVPDGRKYLDRLPRLIVTRTFSKAYGLAGLRIGYSMQCPEITEALKRFKPLHSVNNLAEMCARAALSDQIHLKYAVDFCHTEKKFLLETLKSLTKYGIELHQTETNFILIKFSFDTDILIQRLLTEFGIITAPLDASGIKGGLRISPGTREQNERLVQAMQIILEEIW